ncbi:MAG: hypothetical protein LBJ13_01355 [Puniceicoccales bacterium]|jgi:hypothetical protein|nr:hypothetical protein [Puniceicoccales bacterium]
MRNKLLLGLWVLLNIRFQGNHLLSTELLTVASPCDDIPVATIYSPEAHKDIGLEPHKQHIKKILEKRKKYENSDLLIVPNATSGIAYTFIGGIIPSGNPLLDEIDALKVFGDGNSRNDLVQLIENPKNLSRKEVQKDAEILKSFFQEIIKYITFLEPRFDGNNQQNIKTLREQLQILWDEYFDGLPRVHAQELLSFLEKLNHLRLDLPENLPFSSLQEFFHPGILLYYVMENGIIINGFNFETLIKQNPLNISLEMDMPLPLETLFARLSSTTKREDKQLIVSSANPSQYPTRPSNFQFPQYVAIPNFTKIAFRETKP